MAETSGNSQSLLYGHNSDLICFDLSLLNYFNQSMLGKIGIHGTCQKNNFRRFWLL